MLMGKKVLAIVAALVLMVSVVACKKKEERPVAQAPQQQEGIMMPPGETQIIVPDFVSGKWDAVVLSLENKETNSFEDVTVKLGSEYMVPDSNLKIQVNEFLPDFLMDGLTITSRSEELNNPAVRVVVYEGDAEIFKGWLYSKFPAIHPFQHEKYGLMLKEAAEAG
jgi:hypothetical protein